MKTISVQVSNVFHRQLRIAAAHAEVSRSHFIRQALEEKLAGLTASIDDGVAKQDTPSTASVSEASAIDGAGDTSISVRGEGATGEGITR